MKVTDLMIDDLLKWKEQPGFNDEDRNMVLRVKRIYDDSIKIDGRFELYHISLFEPIPLSVEILEKNGLEKDNHGRIWGEYFDEDSNQDLEITVDSKTGEVWWSYNWNEYYIIRLRYVHQLQHALRLCGIEKEIIL